MAEGLFVSGATDRYWREFDVVLQIVWREWNPIGCVVPYDEYCSYIGGLHGLLASGGNLPEVFRQLWTIETESIGLQGNRVATEEIAARLVRLAADWPASVDLDEI